MLTEEKMEIYERTLFLKEGVDDEEVLSESLKSVIEKMRKGYSEIEVEELEREYEKLSTASEKRDLLGRINDALDMAYETLESKESWMPVLRDAFKVATDGRGFGSDVGRIVGGAFGGTVGFIGGGLVGFVSKKGKALAHALTAASNVGGMASSGGALAGAAIGTFVRAGIRVPFSVMRKISVTSEEDAEKHINDYIEDLRKLRRKVERKKV